MPKPAPAPVAIGFVALSKFVIANDKTTEVKEAFRQRPHLVDDQPGFVRMEVFSPLDRPQEDLARDSAVRRSSECGGVKILVGGYPFKLAPELWKMVGADGSASGAREAIALGNRLTMQPLAA